METPLYTLSLLTAILTNGSHSSNSGLTAPSNAMQCAYSQAISKASGQETEEISTGLFDEQLQGYATCGRSEHPPCHVAVMASEIIVFGVSEVHFANLGKIGAQPLDGKGANTSPVRWRSVAEDPLEVTFETRVWIDDSRHAVQEPLLVHRTRGPFFR